MTYFPAFTRDRETADLVGEHLAAHLRAGPARSAYRAKFIIPLIAFTGIVALQEGYGAVDDVLNIAGSSAAVYRLPDDVLSALAAIGIIGITLMAPRVYKRTLARLERLGLNDE